MSDNPRPTCSTCPYWDSTPVDVGKGSCHRNAPTPGNSSAWRPTGPDEFCGQHPDFPAYIATIRGNPAADLADLGRLESLCEWERAFRLKVEVDLDRVSRLCDVYADEIIKLNEAIATIREQDGGTLPSRTPVTPTGTGLIGQTGNMPGGSPASGGKCR